MMATLHSVSSLFILCLIVMFSASVRAFTSTTVHHAARRASRFAPQQTMTVRFMSSSNPPDTTIVDICRNKISSALDTEDVNVQGAFDDPNGSHVAIQVVSDKFEGKRPVQRQQMVYKALWEELQGPLHAVDSMVCKTPDEAAAANP